MQILTTMAILAFAAACSQAEDNSLPAQADTAEAQAEADYVWTISVDPSGFYLPSTTLSANGWTVDMLVLPREFEFEAWRAGDSDYENIALWIEAYPNDAEPQINAMGQEYYPDSIRVRPDRLIMEDGRFEFYAAESPMGSVLVSGQIRAEHLQGDSMEPQADEPALIGGAEIGGERLRNVSFMHWLGH